MNPFQYLKMSNDKKFNAKISASSCKHQSKYINKNGKTCYQATCRINTGTISFEIM